MRIDRTSTRWVRRSLVIGLIAGFLPMVTTGCFGKFQLIRKTYQWNKDVSQDKWIQWFMFLILSIIPIYGIAGLVDVVLANSMEFWTGENPIQADVGTRKVVQGPNGELITMELLPDRSIGVQAIDASGQVQSFRVAREAESLSAWDADGRLLARVGDVDGQPGLVAAH